MAASRGSVDEFIEDIEPFFYGRRLNYVDVGAFKGEVFKKLKASRLRLREVHLIEPNPESLDVLRREVAELVAGQNYHIHQLALSDDGRPLRMRRAQSMTKVVEVTAGAAVDAENLFEVRGATLDELSRTFTERHISLLKIDVEGSELSVLRGARALLESQQIDMVYVEAGMSPDNKQQCYYRHIEDALAAHGYRLFRIYEQMHEWIEDSPFLRRVNLAYMSQGFSKNNPYRISQELFKAQRQLNQAQLENESVRKRAEQAEAQIVAQAEALKGVRTRVEQLDRELAGSQALAAERKAQIAQMVEQVSVEKAGSTAARSELVELGAKLADEARRAQGLRNRVEQLGHELSAARALVVEKQAQSVLAADRLAAEKADSAALRAELGSLKARLNDEARQAQALRTQMATQEIMAREVLHLVDSTKWSLRRSQQDSLLAVQREERTRRKLAYRLGETLLRSARNPLRWIALPVALGRTYAEYRSDKAQGLLAKPAPVADAVQQFQKSQLILIPKSVWQTIALPATRGEARVWLSSLAVSADGATCVEVETASEQARDVLAALPGAAADAASGLTLELQPGRPLPLGELDAPAEIRLRKVRGVPSILKFEVRGVVRAGMTTKPVPDALKTTSTLRPEHASGQRAADLRPVAVRVQEPKPMKSAIIWQAAQLMQEGKTDLAIDFASRHARDFVRPAISLLKANRAIENETEWLRHVNDYVRQFDIAALELERSGGSLLGRLTTAPLPHVDQGPLVSVIMPAFQAEQTLAVAAKSILRQTWRPLELIIVDDCSSDRTSEAAQEIAKSDSRVRVLRNRANVGPYVSKNLALTIAQGVYVTGHDADDWAHPQRIERHVAAMLSSGGKLRASMTRMIRFNGSGLFGHFAKEGKTSDDGVLRDAAISCMFEIDLLRKELGFWDSVRFGADSELIGRAERVLQDRFARLRQLSMLCLDAEGSLTNDPIHGVSREHGISPTRRYYRDQWTEWHAGLDPASAFLPFPHHQDRRFSAPEAAQVPEEQLRIVVDDLAALSSR